MLFRKYESVILMNIKYIGSNIKKLREERGITQAQLAERLGVSFQAVSKWECGTTVPDVGILPDVAELFGVTVDFLFREDGGSRKERAERLVTAYEEDVDNSDAFEKANSAYQKFFEHGYFDSEDLFHFAYLNELRMIYYGRKAERYYAKSLENRDGISDDAYYKFQRQYISFLSRTGDNRYAVSIAERQYEKEPESPYAAASLVFVYIRGEKYEKAKLAVDEALSRFPENSLLLTFAGDISRALGDDKKAVEYWEKAFAIDEEMIDAQYSLATYFLEAGKKDEALNIFKLIFDWKAKRGFGNDEEITFTDLNLNNLKEFL